MSEGKKEPFNFFEDAFEEDLAESHLCRKKFAGILWKNKNHNSAYFLLHNKTDPTRKGELTINEVINGLKVMGNSENSVRYFCSELGYNMPTRKEDEKNIAEEEIEEINAEMDELTVKLYEKNKKKKELIEKINKVK